jgi:hypothetical protein
LQKHPGLLKRPGFYHTPHDPVAICMESYISDFSKCSNNISPPILTSEYCVMKDFQDHIIEHVPLLIKERPWVEISSTRLAGSTEQHKEEGISRQLISYPEPVCGQVSSGIGQPASVLRPLVHSEDIMPQVNNHGGQEMFSDQLNSHGIRYGDPVGSYMELFFPKALEPINLFPFSTFGGMDSMVNLIFICLSYLPSILWSICGKEKGRITKQYGWLWWKFAFT